MHTARVFKLEQQTVDNIRRFISDRITLSEDKREVVLTVTRMGKFYDPRYGEFEITREMLLSMINNFNAGVYGQEIILDRAHNPNNGSCGFFRKLFLDGTKLRAKVELTEFGVDSIKKRGFIYVSAEFSENFIDNENRKEHGPTLLGAGLTPRPVIKHLDPIQLSEESLDKVPVYLSHRVENFIQEEIEMNLKELMQRLRKKLSEFNLAEAIVSQLIGSFETVAAKAADEKMQMELMEVFALQGKTLAEAIGNGETNIKLDFSGVNMGTSLSEDDVKKLLQEQEDAKVKKLAETTASLTSNIELFKKELGEAKELEGAPETLLKTLSKAADLITAEMSDDQVKALAMQQISLGQQFVVQSKLTGMGYSSPAAGSVHITVDESNNIKALQEATDRRLGILELPDSRRFIATGGTLLDENKRFAEKVLAKFDAENGAQLHAEHKMLAGGDGIVSDVAVPATFERTVIREALYRMVGLQFVDVGTLDFASSHLIPYSYRDSAAAGRDNTRVYEGGSVPRAGVIQTSETAYPIPQKLSFEVSDELRYLTGSRRIDWNAVAENTRNASRIIGEDSEQLIFNEVLKSSDEYGAVSIANESIAAQADGAKTIFVLAQFPVVRPRTVRDLQGNQVGTTTNPVTVSYNAGNILEYNGTGTQANGTYFVLDYNLGEIYLVNQLGVVQTPANGTAYTVTYSYATNVYKFDTDEGSSTAGVHWDKFLYRYGLRKSIIEDDRYHMANFGLMSGTVMTQVEQAQKFAANYKVNGSDLSLNGNLGRIKDIANFKTSAPGLNMRDQRIIIGERGQTRLRMLKPWSMGEMENQKDSNGRFTGKKEAYGDQFVILHTPTQLKRAYTSIVIYSATTRVAR